MRSRLSLTLICIWAVTPPLLPAPAPVEPAAHKEEKRLEGTWSSVSYSGDGGFLPSAGALGTGKLILKRNEKRILDADHFCREEFHEDGVTFQSSFSAFRVDPKTTPRAIDFILTDPYTGEDAVIYRGIYESKGDALRICRTVKPDGPRPDKFEAAKGSGRALSEWRRRKAK